MNCRARAPFALALAAAASLALPAQSGAAQLPAVKLSQTNTVPECTTPGRLMAFLEARNPNLSTQFATIAADYMRVGEEIGIRWDTAFFQMLLETGNLTFKGDVSINQNNFAGLGATGRKEPGESFPDVATGVKAHLQHLLLYAGETIEQPVAERTRKVQEWGVLANWQKSVKGPMTFAQVAKQWAPTSRAYARDIGSISDDFYNKTCNGPDPKPELMALARPGSVKVADAAPATDAPVTDDTAAPKISGADLARRAVEEARASGSFVRSNLGAGALIEQEPAAKPVVGELEPQAATVTAAPTVKILNAQMPAAEPTAAAAATVPPAAAGEAKTDLGHAKPETHPAKTSEPVKTAAVIGTSAQSAVKPAAAAKAAPAKSACKVWTASYGGTRAIIIKARAGSQDNFTVLDVNEGSENREADAYIAAYAKGGETVAEFASPEQALDKAFELCPEG